MKWYSFSISEVHKGHTRLSNGILLYLPASRGRQGDDNLNLHI